MRRGIDHQYFVSHVIILKPVSTPCTNESVTPDTKLDNTSPTLVVFQYHQRRPYTHYYKHPLPLFFCSHTQVAVFSFVC